MAAEYNIETRVITLLGSDSYFSSASIAKRHWSDNSTERGVAVVVECSAKEPDILTATGRAATWRARLSLTPVTFAPDDASAATIETMALNANRFIEALTAGSLNSGLSSETVIGIEADNSERNLNDRWNERTVSVSIFFK